MGSHVHHIDEIFWEASQLAPGDQREAYLDRTCGEDRELRRRVARLLRAQPKVEGFLERPFAGPADIAARTEVCEGPGSVIGPYKLLEQIGEGGMGLVFMAEQLQPVRRKVALKLIKPGMDSRQVVARFEAERQALALMDHPHIARVFDAGTTTGEPGGVSPGRPYFVMELVRGVPITEFCDQHRLTPRQRLGLFVSVCQAVQHAHQKGIIHRDLKPSNVLVTLHDTVAVPKVIDFGIAKATGQQLTERTLFTQFAQVVGTPLYMSPEQAQMNGLDVDTRSDVYSLGVLLYELLTGTTPFEAETLRRAGLDEVRRLIREEEPPPPSQRVSTLGAQACETVSERRGVDGRRLRQLLRGELDWVVMRCLEKDRDRRYESASALAADVQRYLDDEPVAACPPSAAYRLRKYARRNRRMLVTGGVVAAVLVAATVVSTWQAVVARDAQRQAATEAAIARAVNDFLQGDLLGQAASAPQPGQDLSGDVYLTVKEAVHRAAARIGQRFQDQPLVEAAIRTTIGAAYNNLHEYQLALVHFERAVALRKAHLGPDHVDTLGSMGQLATACRWVGRHLDSIALRLQILDCQQARLGPDHPETLVCVHCLAHDYWAAGKLDTSGRLLKELLAKQRTIMGPTHPDTLGTMYQLALNYEDEGRLDESMALHENVVQLRKTITGPRQDPLIKLEMGTIAQVYQRAGKLEQSERLLRDILEVCRKRDNNPRGRTDTADVLGWLARALLLQRKFDEAEPLIREAVTIFENYQPHAIRRFYWTSLLGDVLLGQHKYDEAEPFILKGYEGTKQLEHIWPARGRRRVAETSERVVRFYEVTNQPEKARMWREKLTPAPSRGRNK